MSLAFTKISIQLLTDHGGSSQQWGFCLRRTYKYYSAEYVCNELMTLPWSVPPETWQSSATVTYVSKGFSYWCYNFHIIYSNFSLIWKTDENSPACAFEMVIYMQIFHFSWQFLRSDADSVLEIIPFLCPFPCSGLCNNLNILYSKFPAEVITVELLSLCH